MILYNTLQLQSLLLNNIQLFNARNCFKNVSYLFEYHVSLNRLQKYASVKSLLLMYFFFLFSSLYLISLTIFYFFYYFSVFPQKIVKISLLIQYIHNIS